MVDEACRTQKHWRWVLEEIEARRQTGTLVEVGAQIGARLAVAKERGWQVLGYDTNPDCVRVAESLHGVNVVCADVVSHRPAPMADVVVLNHLIGRFADPMPMLEASYGMLKPGGLLVINTLNWNFARPVVWFCQRTGMDLPHLEYISPATQLRLYSPYTMKVLASRLEWDFDGVLESPARPGDHLGSGVMGRLMRAASRGLSRLSRDQIHMGANMTAFFTRRAGEDRGSHVGVCDDSRLGKVDGKGATYGKEVIRGKALRGRGAAWPAPPS